MIHRIVSQCYVGDTNRQVIRHVIGRLAEGYTTWQRFRRDKRKEIMRACIDEHEANWRIWMMATGGLK